MKFENNLVLLRKKLGLSQEELAFVVGVSRQTIYTWESGLNYPNIVMLKKLADTLECKTDDLLNGFEVNKLPNEIPSFTLTYVGKHNGDIQYEELPNWFVKLKKEEEVSFALYDYQDKKFIRDYSYHVSVNDNVVVHDLNGIEIEVKEYDSSLSFIKKYHQYISVKDNGVAWIGQEIYQDNIKVLKTYKDKDFLNDWGYDKKLFYQSFNYGNGQDYILEYNGIKQNVIMISYFDPDGSADSKHAYFEVFLNQNGESLIWKRYTKNQTKKELSNIGVNVDEYDYDLDYICLTSRL